MRPRHLEGATGAMPWWIWIILGVLALVGESATMALYLLYFGVAAFVVAALAAFGLWAPLQLAAFLVVSVALLGAVRPRTLHLLSKPVPRGMLTNQGVRPDRQGTVVEDVTTSSGMIQLGKGDFWTARALETGARIVSGNRVRVVFVDGLTAFVEPAEPEALLREEAAGS